MPSRYNNYVSVKCERLRQIPAHWRLVPCRAIVAERREKNQGLKYKNYLSLMANVGIIPYEEKGDVGNKKPDDLANCKIVKTGDFVINSMNYAIGSYGVSSYDGVCSQVYVVLRPNLMAVLPGFASRIFECRNFQGYAQSFGNGILAHRSAIGWDILKRLPILLPDFSEQKLIASYLDQSLRLMDSAIGVQERMIELLKERRSAIITQAVTKGLDPKAKMKDSGVPWLGQVPAHWEVKRVRHLVRINASNVDKKTVEGEEAVRLCNYTDVYYNERIVLGPEYMAASASREQIEKLALKVGDVIITKDSEEPDDIGIPAIVYESAPDLVCGYHLALLRPEDSSLGPFIGRAIASQVSKAYFHVNAKGVTRFALGYHAIADLPLGLPPREEAQAIAVHLDESLTKIDSAISSQERMIELLKERRSAIITQAVTGQMDVR